MTGFIQEIVEKARTAEERERAALRAKVEAARAERRERAAAAEQVLRALLGPLAEEADIEWVEDVVNSIVFNVFPGAWMGHIGFGVRRDTDGWFIDLDEPRRYEIKLALADDWHSNPKLMSFIHGLNDRFENELARAVSRSLELLERAPSVEYARTHHAHLMEIAPARVEEWDRALREWERARAEKEAAAAQRRERFDAYITALTAWRVEYERTLTANRAAVKGIQAGVDEETFVRYRIAYGAGGGSSESGAIFGYAEEAWSRDAEPDENGYYRFFEDGNIVRRRLLAPLWIEEGIEESVTEAGPGPWRVTVYADEAGQPVYCLPWQEGMTRLNIRQQMKRLPAEPSLGEFGEEFADGLTSKEHAAIAAVTGDMKQVDIPF